eukprot:403358576
MNRLMKMRSQMMILELSDATIKISSFLNISAIDLVLIEGKYVNQMIKMSITDVDTVSNIDYSNQTQNISQNVTLKIQQAQAIQQIISDFNRLENRICTVAAQIQITRDAKGTQKLNMVVYEKQDLFLPGLFGGNCLPPGTKLRIIGSSNVESDFAEEAQKIWHISAIVTVLCIAATYFTLNELRQIHLCLELRETVGQRESYAKNLSLLSYCLLCMWNMSYAMTFFVGAMYFQQVFSYFAIPAFWFFILAFVFQSRVLIMLKALNNYDQGYTRDIMRKQLMKFFIIYYICTFIMITYFQLILISSTLTLFLSGLVWVPQIIKNIQYCSRNTPNIGFAISQQLLVSFLPLYLRGCPNNLLKIKPQPGFCFLYALFISLQFIILFVQKYKGPRFMIPRSFRPNTYDYVRKFRDVDDLESASQSEEQSYLNDECVVCMHNLRFEVDESMQLVDGSQVRAKSFMQTPCNHKFHAKCLQSWMKVKMECPVCRKILPPNVDD